MQSTELERVFPGNLKRNREVGEILLDEKRIIFSTVEMFQTIVNRLVSLSGKRVAKVILGRLGNELGHIEYAYFKNDIHSADDLEPVFDRLIQDNGWGRCKSVKYKADHSMFTFAMANCPWCANGCQSTDPICYLLRGVVEGFVEEHTGRNAKSSDEIECHAVGDPYCEIEVSFTKVEGTTSLLLPSVSDLGGT